MSPLPQPVSSCALFTKGVGCKYKSLLQSQMTWVRSKLQSIKKKSPTFMIEMTKSELVEDKTLHIKRCSCVI